MSREEFYLGLAITFTWGVLIALIGLGKVSKDTSFGMDMAIGGLIIFTNGYVQRISNSTRKPADGKQADGG